MPRKTTAWHHEYHQIADRVEHAKKVANLTQTANMLRRVE
jgi:hypothetical protein